MHSTISKYKAVQDSVEVLDNRKLFSELEVKYETQKDEALVLQQFEIENRSSHNESHTSDLSARPIALATLGFLYFGAVKPVIEGKNAFIARALEEKSCSCVKFITV
jgi:hypothetical protein